MPFVDIGQGRLFYSDHRQADATRPPLVLIHGAGATHDDFPPSLQALHAIAPDLPGHGQSDSPSFHHVDDYAASMQAFLDVLKLSEFYLMGHSMGGAIAQMLALNMPGRVRGLILLATGAHLPVSPTLLQGLKEQVMETLGLIVKWEWAKDAPQDWRDQSLKRLLQTPPHVILGDYYACSRFDVRSHLSKLTVPTLIIGAEADRMTPPTLQQDLAGYLPHATLHTIASAGHMVALEQPDVVTALVQDWIAQQEKTH